MKKKLWIIGIFVVLIAAMVLLLPWPTRVDLQMQGAAVTSDGETVQDLEFSVTGWKLDFLLFEDKLKVDIAFQAEAPLKYTETLSGELYSQLSDECYVTSYSAYDSESNSVAFGYLALSKEWDYCILTTPSESWAYILGTADSESDLHGVLDIAKALFN